MTDPELREQLDELSEDLSALANLQRLRLLHLLTSPQYGEEIGEALGMSRQAALKHIGKLEERGFVRSLHGRRETGPVIEYQVVPQRLFALGVTISDLGKLEPEGGPADHRVQPTMVFNGDDQDAGSPSRAASDAARLLVINGADAGSVYPLTGEGPRWTIGRSEDRDVVQTHDPYISSHHAEVQVDPEGHAVIDVHSANGTFVNFKRIASGGRVPLRCGDVIGVGRTHLVYQDRPEGR